ncbi:hypothetical protein M8C21_007524, partial [Ambrosia artemisiifolia]
SLYLENNMAIDGVASVENGKKENSVNGHVGENESVPVEKAPEPSFPKDAVDEWPEEKKFHSLYFVKYRTVEDQALKAKLDQADKDLKKLNLARDPITEKLRAKRNERAQSIGVDLDGVRKDQQAIKAKLKTLETEKEAINTVIASLEEELRVVIEKRDKVYDKIRELRNKREEGNTCFYQNRSLLNDARRLAASKDVNALIELSTSEVDKFMSEWNSSKAFREDYEKRILQSLDMRQLSKDGRMRNPEEKPLVAQQSPAPVPVETEVVAKPKVKQPKEDPAPPPPPVASVEKEKDSKKPKEGKKSKNEKLVVEEEEEEVYGLEKKPAKTEVVDEVKLKEMKREEEIAKAKQALERKKKLAEKAAIKAKKKAEKEAEKKLKDREKKEKKKMQASMPAVEAAEEPTVEEAAVEEPPEEKETVKLPTKTKETIKVRGRSNRGRGPESLSKVILKRKKSNNYMYYYASGAAAIITALLAVGYNMYA